MQACLDLPVLAVSVEAVDDVAKDLGDVDWDFQGANDAGVAVGQAVLDVVQRGVDQHAAVVPCRALHPDCLMHCTQRTVVTLAMWPARLCDAHSGVTLEQISLCLTPAPQKKVHKS